MIINEIKIHKESKFTGSGLSCEGSTYSIIAFMIQYRMNEDLAAKFHQWNSNQRWPNVPEWFNSLTPDEQKQITRIEIETGNHL